MTEPNLSGDPDPTLLCPEPDEAATNYMNDAGVHESVYEAQVVANGDKGWNGEDGFPMCCACGYERSEHTARVVDVTEQVRREQEDRLTRLANDPSLTPDELRYMTGAPQDTEWLHECKLVAEGKHPDPGKFADSVRRLTRIAWTYADRLEDREALGDEDEDEKTYDEYLWFFLTREEAAASEGEE